LSFVIYHLSFEIMDQLKNFYSQLKDMFLGMTPGNQVTVALLLVGLLVSLGFLLVGMPGSGGDYVAAYGGKYFDHSRQMAIADALAKQNLNDYDWKEGKLIVPKRELTKYVGAISEAKIVTGFNEHLLATVNKLGAYESGRMIDEKMRQAKQVAVADVLKQYSWISDAAVFSTPRIERDRNLYDKKIINSVSVHVFPHKDEPLTEEQRCTITQAVRTAFGVTDLKEISITDSYGNSYYGSDEKTRGGTKNFEDTQEYHRMAWEKRFREHFPDIGGLLVSATVDLDPTLWRKAHDVTHGKPTTVAMRERNTDLSKSGPDIAGRPGFIPQQSQPVPNPLGQLVQGSKMTETTEDSERASALQGVEGQSQIAGLIPKMVTASFRVPISYIKKIWMEQNATPDGTTPEPTEADLQAVQTALFANIQKTAAKLLETVCPPEIIDATELVVVTSYPDSKPVIEAKSTFAQMLAAWFNANWETLSLLGLVLVGMGVLWNMTRVRQPPPITIYEAAELPQEEVPMSDEELAAQEAAEGIKRSLEPFSKSIVSLQNEVADLVNENPDAAVSVLRQWIGNVTFQE